MSAYTSDPEPGRGRRRRGAAGTAERKERFLARVKGDKPSWGAMASIEPSAGSDSAGIQAPGRREGDHWVPGHGEGDLLAGGHHSHVATLVERQSRFTLLVKVPGRGKDTASVVPALARQMRTLPAALRRSLTWDRGLELAQHAAFTVATDVQVHFCDPRSLWQRGTNENTNRLLRQYLPKGTDLTTHSQAALNRIALRLNARPRKTLGYQTPAAILAALLR